MRELLARVDSRELTEWMAYEREYGPLGPERGDWQAAQVAHTFALVNGGKKARSLKVTDFLLRWRKPAPQTPQQQLTVLRALAGIRGRR